MGVGFSLNVSKCHVGDLLSLDMYGDSLAIIIVELIESMPEKHLKLDRKIINNYLAFLYRGP